MRLIVLPDAERPALLEACRTWAAEAGWEVLVASVGPEPRAAVRPSDVVVRLDDAADAHAEATQWCAAGARVLGASGHAHPLPPGEVWRAAGLALPAVAGARGVLGEEQEETVLLWRVLVLGGRACYAAKALCPAPRWEAADGAAQAVDVREDVGPLAEAAARALEMDLGTVDIQERRDTTLALRAAENGVEPPAVAALWGEAGITELLRRAIGA